jgi:hypothetical protein
MSILPQPHPTLPVVRKDFFQCGPEIPRMIFFFNVHEFMNQDVIDDPQGGHDDSPAKR